MFRRTTTILATLAVTLSPIPTTGAERAYDNQDVRGPFDLAALSQPQRDGDNLLFALRTHEPWTVEQVRSGGFAIRIDSDEDDDFDRFVLIEWKDAQGPGGKLQARVVLPSGETIARKRARHPKPRRLRVWLDRKLLGIEKGPFHIDAYSLYFGARCPDDGCRDYIPDEGRLRVMFGGVCGGREPDITGTPDGDKITTRGRDVVVTGLGGDDVVRVKWGSVTVCGGAGRDFLIGGGRADVLAGGVGNDEISLRGTGGRANVGRGGAGNDLLYGGTGPDRLFGNGGDDYLEGRGDADFLDGGDGRDDLSGGGGADTCTDGRNTGGC